MNELIPFGCAALGKSLDCLTTALYCTRFDYHKEQNDLTKEFIEKYGTIEGIVRKGTRDQVIIAGLGLVLYLFDRLDGVENDHMNLHNIWLYTVGAVTSSVAVNNFVEYIIELFKENISKED